MALYQGVTGKLALGQDSAETYLAHMTSWSVDFSTSIDETPFFGGSKTEEGYTEKTPGAKSWTASADGAADFATDSGQRELMTKYLNQEPVVGTFYLNAETAIQGEAYIESLSISHSADGKAEISISLSGNGAPTMIYPA